MDTSSSAVVDAVSLRKGPLKRQYRSSELKRQIVEETLVPGASVARVARAHGVNANQVFGWRRQYRQGLLKAERRALPGLLAVRVTDNGGNGKDTPTPRRLSGLIQVELAQGRLQVMGSVDGEALRVVLEALRG